MLACAMGTDGRFVTVRFAPFPRKRYEVDGDHRGVLKLQFHSSLKTKTGDTDSPFWTMAGGYLVSLLSRRIFPFFKNRKISLFRNVSEL